MGPWLWKELSWCVGARCRQSASPAALPCPAASLWFPGPAELLGSKPPLLGYQQWLPSAGGRGWYPRQWELSGTSRHRIARTSLTGPACEIMQAARHVKQCGCHSICKKQCCGANQHKINAAWSAAPRDPHAGAVGAQLCTVWLCTVQLCTLTPKSPEINLVGRDWYCACISLISSVRYLWALLNGPTHIALRRGKKTLSYISLWMPNAFPDIQYSLGHWKRLQTDLLHAPWEYVHVKSFILW